MLELIQRYSFPAILIAVLLEEMGIPMPIPTDVLIVTAGVHAGRDLPLLVLWFALLSLASATGASVLYAFVRRGGRPLVERFGKYVHLGPEQLLKSEAFLKRTGWVGIAVGRSIPGLRYVTVIACGLLDVPYWRFISAHLVGSSVYIIAFLALGAAFGPIVTEWIHVPALWLHLLWMALLSVGLPLLIVWLSYRAHPQRPVNPSKRRILSAALLASFAGTTVLAATWGMAATIAELAGDPRPLDVTHVLARWLLGRGFPRGTAYTVIYAGLLAFCLAVSFVYYDVVLPRISRREISLQKQVLGLVLLGVIVIISFLAPAVVGWRSSPLAEWWQAGGPLLIAAIGAGIVAYALTTVYTRALVVAVLPSLFRRGGATEPIALPAEPRPTLVPVPVPPADEAHTSVELTSKPQQ